MALAVTLGDAIWCACYSLLAVWLAWRLRRAQSVWGQGDLGVLLPIYVPMLRWLVIYAVAALVSNLMFVLLCATDEADPYDSCALAVEVITVPFFAAGCIALSMAVLATPAITPAAVRHGVRVGVFFGVWAGPGSALLLLVGDHDAGLFWFTAGTASATLGLLVYAVRQGLAARRFRPAAQLYYASQVAQLAPDLATNLIDMASGGSDLDIMALLYGVGTIAGFCTLFIFERTLQWDSDFWAGARDRLRVTYERGYVGAAAMAPDKQFLLQDAVGSNADLLLSWAPLSISDRQLGRGGFAAVYAATYGREPVAAKVFTTPHSVDDDAIYEYLGEVRLSMALRHSNVVTVHGVVVSPPTICLLLELCDLGDLRSVLEKSGATLTTLERLELARQATAAVAYLHSQEVIHRDIKGVNYLLSSQEGESVAVKLSDFGESVLDRGSGASTLRVGTVLWMAPELMVNDEDSRYDAAVDVFSLGMTLFEIFAGERPWLGLTSPMAVFSAVSAGQRPEFPDGADLAAADLIRSLWSHSPRERPTAAEALAAVEELMEPLGHVDHLQLLRKVSRSFHVSIFGSGAGSESVDGAPGGLQERLL